VIPDQEVPLRGSWWLDRSIRVKGLAVVAIPIAALLASLATYTTAVADAQDATAWVDHTYAVRQQLSRTFELVVDCDGRVRLYAITRDRAELERAHRATDQLGPHVTQLAALVADNRGQAERVDRLRPLVADRVEVARRRQASVEAGGADDDRLFERALELNNDIRRLVDEMDGVETALLAERRAATAASLNRNLSGVVVAGIVGGLVATMLFATSVSRRVRRLADNAERLAVDRDLVPEPAAADEIGRVNAALDTASRMLGDRRQQEQRSLAEAHRANQAKTQLLSRMSHELRTPMNAVLGFTEILRFEDLSDDARDDVEQIGRAGKHLLGLIDEVLDLTAVEQGALSVEPAGVRIGDAVEHVLARLGPAAEAAGLTVVHDRAGSDLEVYADPRRLDQVLMNLVSNAVKYNSSDGHVLVAHTPRDDGTVRTTVADTGPGIDPGQREAIFQPFERLGNEVTDTAGTGIGLSLSCELARAMYGDITLDDDAPVGSTFRLDLPAAPSRHLSDTAVATGE
jgi:signal transduction histidine kinase